MKTLMRKFETMMVASAFAEEGEFETARQLLKEDRPKEGLRQSADKRKTERKVLRAE